MKVGTRMRKMFFPVAVLGFIFFALVKGVWAEDQTFADKFLGSPLLILMIVTVVALIAVVFHKIRR